MVTGYLFYTIFYKHAPIITEMNRDMVNMREVNETRIKDFIEHAGAIKTLTDLHKDACRSTTIVKDQLSQATDTLGVVQEAVSNNANALKKHIDLTEDKLSIIHQEVMRKTGNTTLGETVISDLTNKVETVSHMTQLLGSDIKLQLEINQQVDTAITNLDSKVNVLSYLQQKPLLAETAEVRRLVNGLTRITTMEEDVTSFKKRIKDQIHKNEAYVEDRVNQIETNFISLERNLTRTMHVRSQNDGVFEQICQTQAEKIHSLQIDLSEVKSTFSRFKEDFAGWRKTIESSFDGLNTKMASISNIVNSTLTFMHDVNRDNALISKRSINSEEID